MTIRDPKDIERRAKIMRQRELWASKMVRNALAVIENSGKSDAAISRETGIAAQTLGNWRSGKTKRPQMDTIRFALRACGAELVIQARVQPVADNVVQLPHGVRSRAEH